MRGVGIDEVVQSTYKHDIYGPFYELACSRIAVQTMKACIVKYNLFTCKQPAKRCT